ncbi:hypothetical protein LZG04_11830 [Saccharothrix sp. S26]|uniref:hypothetical protein n=1 Tax=Saccharothrix sp. S26 TaxID=2907215 RepID=UPI001F24DD58|nr:hypothetical protein [Saccharothrix sp. S26]MCE6995488.1 hypothetical protein [Saccharothrix sp. S26]
MVTPSPFAVVCAGIDRNGEPELGTADPLAPLLVGVLTAMGFVMPAGLGVVSAWDVGRAGPPAGAVSSRQRQWST